MLCRVALHDELAALSREVGPQVFDDPVTFRAAFDDYVAEGSASTGEASLLVGAIATGALQRLRDQVALGADPEMAIASQGDALARDRGTSESQGARWALSVLAHALGIVPDDLVLTRPATGSVPQAGTPQGVPVAVDPGPTQGVPAAEATQVAGDQPLANPVSRRRGLGPLLVGVLVVLAVVAAATVTFLLMRDDDSPGATADDTTSTTADTDEETLAEVEVTDAGKTVRVRLVREGREASVVLLAEHDGAETEVDRVLAGCPYLDTSYGGGIEDQGDGQLFWGWLNNGGDAFGEYGEVQVEEEVLTAFGIGDEPCPGAG